MPNCDGRLIKAHLIPRPVIKRFVGGQHIWDAPVWRWACGGVMGNGGHHGAFDGSRRLRIARFQIPAELEEWATDYDLEWFLDRTYGPR
jgi:hypothetical protein